MEQISGYARVMSRARVEQQQNKPFFGKPYLKLGQCFPLWDYSFQLGGILGAKHSTNLDAFGTAFLGLSGKTGSVMNYFTEAANGIIKDYTIDSMGFLDYVGAEFLGRLGQSSDVLRFISEHGMEKLPAEDAEKIAWQYSAQGAALGAILPQVMREMFGRSHVTVPKEKWQLAYNSGLDIGPEQVLLSYENVEGEENEMFMDYCQKCCPSLYSILISKSEDADGQPLT